MIKIKIKKRFQWSKLKSRSIIVLSWINKIIVKQGLTISGWLFSEKFLLLWWLSRRWAALFIRCASSLLGAERGSVLAKYLFSILADSNASGVCGWHLFVVLDAFDWLFKNTCKKSLSLRWVRRRGYFSTLTDWNLSAGFGCTLPLLFKRWLWLACETRPCGTLLSLRLKGKGKATGFEAWILRI